MSPKENNPQEESPDVETGKPEVPTTEDKAPEKTGTKPKKKRAPSKPKKSEGEEGVVPEITPTGFRFDFRKKPDDTKIIEVESQTKGIAPTSDVDKTLDPPAVIETRPTVPLTTDTFVDEAVKFINETANKAVYKGSAEIGAYVLKNFFGNNIELASSRNPHKPESYSKLCRHSELLVTSDALGVMVRVAAQEKFFSDNNVNTTGLSYSHKAELVKLRNGQKKLGTVRLALEEGWSVKHLKEVVYDMREGGMDREPDSEILLLGRYVKSLATWRDKLSNSRGEVLFFEDR
jgi:hypothetical protein